MGSVTQGFMKLFRGSSRAPHHSDGPSSHPRSVRRSSGLGEFTRALDGRDTLCVLDIGPTSASNIRHLTELGHKIYSEDVLLASRDPALVHLDKDDNKILDEKRFLSENLAYPSQSFDAVLAWDMADFMEESLVKPVVGRLWSMLRPGGLVLAFFHTKDAGPDAPFYRYHIGGKDTLEVQPLTISAPTLLSEAGNGGYGRGAEDRVPAYRLQRVFNNRHIENLFRDFSAIKFFLARDNVREVLVTR